MAWIQIEHAQELQMSSKICGNNEHHKLLNAPESTAKTTSQVESF